MKKISKTIGLALGGGGVRGLAHIPVLEALDELELKPAVIAGTSMGAIIGALYASGMSGRQIRKLVKSHIISKDDTWREVLDKKTELLMWVDSFLPGWGRGGLVSADRFFRYLFDEICKTTFEELEIPLVVIATDFWEAREVIFERGELLPALQASMAVPGVFTPVSFEGKVLVDGGAVNLVPYDHLIDRCDLTIAVNVGRDRIGEKTEVPSVIESILGTFDIMQSVVLEQRMKYRAPDVYLRPRIKSVRMLDFGKMDEIFEQSEPVKELLKNRILEKIR